VLARIREAQDGKLRLPSYEKALSQIRAGAKTGHWIWYVWPCLATLRPGTSQPSFLLPDFAAAQAFLHDEVLLARLIEITTVAMEQLRRGVAPKVLFGGETDAGKFTETMTFFAVAAAENGDAEQLQFFAEALRACKRRLDPRTMGVVVETYNLPRYRDVVTTRQLLAIAIGTSAPGAEVAA